jgi:hypothetical protein
VAVSASSTDVDLDERYLMLLMQHFRQPDSQLNVSADIGTLAHYSCSFEPERITLASVYLENAACVHRPLLGEWVWLSRETRFALSMYILGWFTGLSAAFLAARTARLLVLAGTDRLDKELMIGQMQGKFQMNVVPGTGHMLHEARFSLQY